MEGEEGSQNLLEPMTELSRVKHLVSPSLDRLPVHLNDVFLSGYQAVMSTADMVEMPDYQQEEYVETCRHFY